MKKSLMALTAVAASAAGYIAYRRTCRTQGVAGSRRCRGRCFGSGRINRCADCGRRGSAAVTVAKTAEKATAAATAGEVADAAARTASHAAVCGAQDR